MRNQTFLTIVKGMFGWLKKHKPPEPKSPVRNPDEYLGEDRITQTMRQRQAEDVNRSKFPSRRVRLQLERKWKRMNRQKRMRARARRAAWLEHERQYAYRFFFRFFFDGGFRGLIRNQVIRLGGKVSA